MQPNETQEIFSVLVRIIKRRKWLITACTAAVLIPIAVYNHITPPVYQASSLLVFEKFSNPIDSYEYEISKESFLSNQIEEIQTYAFNASILEVLPPATLDRFAMPAQPEPDFNRNEHIIRQLQKGLSANPIKGSNIVRINYQGLDRELCTVIANAAADVLRQRNLKNKKKDVGNVRRYIEEQAELYKQQLESAEAELRTFKEIHHLTSVDREAEELQRRMTEAEISYNTIKTERGAMEKRLRSLNEKIASQREDLVPTITDIGNSWAQKLRDRLVELNSQYLDLNGQGYPDDHPKMTEIKANINKVQVELRDRAQRIAQGEGTANPIIQIEKYITESAELQIDLATSLAHEEELAAVLQSYRTQLGTLPDKEFTLTKLIRDRDVNRTIYLNLVERLEQAKISEADQNQDIRIIDRAQLPRAPISPQKKLNLAIGLLIGLLTGGTLAFFLEVKNNTVNTPEEIERIANVTILGTIPNITAFSKGKRNGGLFSKQSNHINERIYRSMISNLEPHSVIAESYRMLRSNLQFRGVGKRYKTVLATSIGPGDGKTTTLTNLAISFAAHGNRTLLIDADLRIPQIHHFFDTPRERGVSELLESLNGLDNFVVNPMARAAARHPQKPGKYNQQPANRTQDKKLAELQSLFMDANRTTGISNLNFIPSGKRLEEPSGIVSTGPMPIVLQKFRSRFNIILVDTAPLLLVDDTLILASMVDAVLLVVHPNKYDSQMLLKARQMLKNANANLIGMVFNNFEVQGQYKKYYSEYSEKA